MSLNDLRNSKWVAIACLIFVILMLSACGGGGGDGSDPVDLPPPVNVYSYSEPVEKTDGWTTADAGALGMSVGLLEDMMNTLDTDFDIVDSIAISYRGRLVLDETVRTSTDEFDDRVGNTNPEMHVPLSLTATCQLCSVSRKAVRTIYIGSTAVHFSSPNRST